MLEIPSNVKAFIDKCGSLVAANEKELFESKVEGSFLDNDVASPIEQLFETAVRAIAKLEGYEYDPDPDWVGGEPHYFGVWIRPQVKIGKYCVDYCISVDEQHDAINNTTTPGKTIIVELDGHAFHDTTEKQRRYEKERDRYMQKKGYKVFRYTGAEIVRNPSHAAIECLGEVGILGDGEVEFLQGYYHG